MTASASPEILRRGATKASVSRDVRPPAPAREHPSDRELTRRADDGHRRRPPLAPSRVRLAVRRRRSCSRRSRDASPTHARASHPGTRRRGLPIKRDPNGPVGGAHRTAPPAPGPGLLCRRRRPSLRAGSVHRASASSATTRARSRPSSPEPSMRRAGSQTACACDGPSPGRGRHRRPADAGAADLICLGRA